MSPHPDDEIIGCGTLINKLIAQKKSVTVIYLTNGISREDKTDSNLIKRYGTYNDYFKQRIAERNIIQNTIGFQSICFDNIYSRELYLHIIQTYKQLEKQYSNRDNILFLCPPYEGGHPDHDIANCIASVLNFTSNITVWEYALYNGQNIDNLKQQFLKESSSYKLKPSCKELTEKEEWLQLYDSQYSYILKHLSIGIEYYRPIIKYNYNLSPSTYKVYYESWQNELSTSIVSKACMSLLKNNRK